MRAEHGCTEMMENLGTGIVVQSDLVSVEWEGPGAVGHASGCARKFAVGAASSGTRRTGAGTRSRPAGRSRGR